MEKSKLEEKNREGVCGMMCVVCLQFTMFVRKSLAEMMAFEQKPKESEEHSRQREQQVQKAGNAGKPERLEEAARPE